MRNLSTVTVLFVLCLIYDASALIGSYSGGAGTATDPAQISSVADLLELATTEDDYGEHFILTADLNLSGQSFTSAVISKDTDSDSGFLGVPFSGSFNGNGHVISNLGINASGQPVNDYLGLFGYIEGSSAEVFDLTLANVSITTGSDAVFVGGLCGSNDGIISGCSVSGALSTGIDSETCGGLCGHNMNLITNCQSSVSLTVGDADSCISGGLCGINQGSIHDCSSSGSVSGDSINTAGAFCGQNSGGGRISNCTASGSAAGGTESINIGGFCGMNDSTATIEQCRSSASASGHNHTGGLAGSNIGQIQQCYAMGNITMVGDGGYGSGGLIGANEGAVGESYSIGAFTLPSEAWAVGGLIGADEGGSESNSFWDTETSAQATSAGGTGLTTTQMQTQSIFATAGWDFSEVWVMSGYPIHLSAGTPEVQVVSIQVGGPISVVEESIEEYTCFAFYTDGSSNDVTQTAIWSVSPTNFASISSNGVLTASNVSSNSYVDVQAVYTDADGSYTNTLEILIENYDGSYSSGEGTVESPYLIANKADLLALRATPSDYDKNFALDADIDLAGEVFTNAVIAPSFAHGNFVGTPFRGTFDGQGHVISNLFIDVAGLLADDYLGLFGKTEYYLPQPEDEGGETAAPTAVIKNLGVKNYIFICGELANYIGGLVGENAAGLISGCHATGTITGGDYSEQWGGLCGYNQGTLSNCHANASVLFGDSECNRNGGLVGLNSGSIIDCSASGVVSGGPNQCGYTGGLVGLNVESTRIINCHSEGSVSGSSDVGGLCGRSSDGAVISNCYSSCTVSGSATIGGLIGAFDSGTMADCFATGAVTPFDGTKSVGGLIGYCYSAQIIRSYASGDVACSNGIGYAGGFCGNDVYNTTISNCYATGDITVGGGTNYYVGGFCGRHNGIITRCYSSGTLSLTGALSQIGGFCGTNESVISSSFWDTDTSSMMFSDGGTGKTTAEMQAQSTFTNAGWNFTDTWYMHGYPELTALDTTEKVDYFTWAENEGIPLLEREPEDTPAGDGIPNIIKYTAGLAAMIPYTPADVMRIAPASEDGYFSITYSKSKTAKNAELQPVWTGALDSEWIPEGITHELISVDGDVETWNVSISLDMQGFMRLQVFLPAE